MTTDLLRRLDGELNELHGQLALAEVAKDHAAQERLKQAIRDARAVYTAELTMHRLVAPCSFADLPALFTGLLPPAQPQAPEPQAPEPQAPEPQAPDADGKARLWMWSAEQPEPVEVGGIQSMEWHIEETTIPVRTHPAFSMEVVCVISEIQQRVLDDLLIRVRTETDRQILGGLAVPADLLHPQHMIPYAPDPALRQFLRGLPGSVVPPPPASRGGRRRHRRALKKQGRR